MTSGSTKVGLLYDEYMTKHTNLWDSRHPETPVRLKNCIKSLTEYGLHGRCSLLKTRVATTEDVVRVHSQEYVDLIKSTAAMVKEIVDDSSNKQTVPDVDKLMEISTHYDGVYFHPSTYDCAMMAAGCAIELVEQVVQGKVDNGIALVRTPGHHAMKSEANGYCFFNNVAVATRFALTKLKLKRVLIVDWDVHHGQGVQQLFYDDPRVLYYSSHRYEHGNFWPNLRQSDVDYVGVHKGQGYNINVPLNETGFTDSDMMALFQHILLPVAYEFDPELVIVACGFDAVIGDVESRSEVSPLIYGHLTHMLKSLANGRVCFVLEGGYNLRAIGECASWTVRALLSDPLPSLSLAAIKPSTRQTILRSISYLRPFWQCFAYQQDIDTQSDQLSELFSSLTIANENPVFSRSKPDKYEISGDYEKQSEADVAVWTEKLDKLVASTPPIIVTNRTCLAYDARMREHACRWGDHPEKPDRITRIYQKLVDGGLADKCHMVESRLLTDTEAAFSHSLAYVDTLKGFKQLDTEKLDKEEYKFNSIYLTANIHEIASLSAGYVLNVVDEVMTGRSLNGAAIVRPPGHHAEHDTCMGFCYFNNVAIAAKYARSRYGIKRILIVDWDVHHGNGTQHEFYKDPSVLFVSLHRYDNGSFYPSSDEADPSYTGLNAGQGHNINIAWSRAKMGDAEYVAAFQQVVMPVAYEFCPELVLVSCGFDAARGDPLGGYKITPEGYSHMTHMLMSLAGGRLVLVLEGGYNLTSIADSMYECVSVMLGQSPSRLESSISVHAEAVKCISSVLEAHSPFWRSLNFRDALPSREFIQKQLIEVEANAPAR